jgi:hypothetical protein
VPLNTDTRQTANETPPAHPAERSTPAAPTGAASAGSAGAEASTEPAAAESPAKAAEPAAPPDAAAAETAEAEGHAGPVAAAGAHEPAEPAVTPGTAKAVKAVGRAEPSAQAGAEPTASDALTGSAGETGSVGQTKATGAERRAEPTAPAEATASEAAKAEGHTESAAPVGAPKPAEPTDSAGTVAPAEPTTPPEAAAAEAAKAEGQAEPSAQAGAEEPTEPAVAKGPAKATEPAEAAEAGARTDAEPTEPAEPGGATAAGAAKAAVTADEADAADPAGESSPTGESAPADEPEAAEEAPAEAAPAAAAGPGEDEAGEAEGRAPGGAGAAAPQGARLRAARRRRRAWREAHPVAARVLRDGTTLLAALLVLTAMVLPNRMHLRPAQFTRIPVEALLGGVVLMTLPRRWRLVAAWAGGLVLGALTVLNFFDMGFYEFLGRRFDIVIDWVLLDDAKSYLNDTLGKSGTTAVLIGAAALIVVLVVLIALAVVRLSELLARHRHTTGRTLLVLSMVWMTCTVLGLRIDGVPIASEHTIALARSRAEAVQDTLRDEREFAKTAKADAFGGTPPSQLVPDLRGKDMIFTFIESYGRSAIEDPVMAPGVDKTLAASTKALAKAGFHAKSGWLTSATYGGSSWLGHSTFLSGLWIDNQNRYRTVTNSDHLSLTKAFRKTGDWDTVGIMPGVQKGWPEAKFYGLDKVYNAFQMGYEGPKFSWSTMPDQYALEAFQRLEHSKKRDKPLMSEIILTSSHQPWAPIPKMVGWDQVGDGSVYDAIEKAGKDPGDVFYDSTKVKQEYGKSIQYSVTALTQFLQRYGDDDTVLVFLGDHQPVAKVSGDGANHQVPVSIVAKDPKVLDRIAGWNYTDGLRPAKNAPVWRMSSFRDRFLTAYGSTPHPSKG